MNFRSQAYNARAIQVGHIPNGVVNEPVEFESMYYYYSTIFNYIYCGLKCIILLQLMAPELDLEI